MNNFTSAAPAGGYKPPPRGWQAPPNETEEERRRRIEGAQRTSAGYAAGGGGYNPDAVRRSQMNPTWYGPATPGHMEDLPTTKGSWETPGYGEDYYTRNQSRFDAPTQSSQYWAGQQGFFNGPNEGEDNIRGYANEIGHSPTGVEDLYDQYLGSGAYTTPGDYENFYRDHGQELNNPGAGESAIKGFLPQYNAPGSMEEFWAKNSGALDGPGSLEQHQGAIQGNIDSAVTMADFFGKNRGNLERSGYNERMAQDYRATPSYSEDFYGGGGAGSGLDTLYDRLYEQGSRRLGNEAAAKGGFNSGAALRGTEELSKDLTAQHVRDVQAAAGQADTQKNARLNTQLGIMTGADTSMRGRLDLGFKGARSVDDVALERADAMQKLYEGVGGEKRSNLSTMGGLARDSQSSMLSRLAGGVNAGSTLDNLTDQRFKTRASTAKDAQEAAFDRMTKGLTGAGMASDDRFRRLKGGADLESTASRDELARRGLGGTLSGNADSSEDARLSLGMTAATGAQTLKQDREHKKFEDAMSIAEHQAKTYGAGMDAARREKFDADLAEVNAMVRRGDISAQEGIAKTENLIALIKAPIALGEKIAAKKAGG